MPWVYMCFHYDRSLETPCEEYTIVRRGKLAVAFFEYWPNETSFVPQIWEYCNFSVRKRIFTL